MGHFVLCKTVSIGNSCVRLCTSMELLHPLCDASVDLTDVLGLFTFSVLTPVMLATASTSVSLQLVAKCMRRFVNGVVLSWII